MKVNLKYRSKVATVSVDDSITVDQFTEVVQAETGIHKYRQGLKYMKKDNGKDVPVRLQGRLKTLKDYNVKNNMTLELKDLGPQFSYRGVFLVEYGGPILIMALYAMRCECIFGAGSETAPWNPVAWLAVMCWMAHFLKRELETLFVHRFSRPTMPLFNLFKNSIYYWGFALMVGYPLCSPNYTAPANENQIHAGLGIFVISELLNFTVHMQLRMMRPKEGSDKREPPKGGLFNLASCPNYTFEVLGWIGFSLMTNVAMGWVFTLFGFLQMLEWAMGKHRGYVKQDKSLKRRAAIIPFIL